MRMSVRPDPTRPGALVNTSHEDRRRRLLSVASQAWFHNLLASGVRPLAAAIGAFAGGRAPTENGRHGGHAAPTRPTNPAHRVGRSAAIKRGRLRRGEARR